MLKLPKSTQIRRAATNLQDRLLHPRSLIKSGKTPFEVVKQDSLVTLRHYLPKDQPKYSIPLVIVPPLAVNMLIYDWFPDRTFVKTMVDLGFDVYLIDWGKPDRRHAHYDLATYINDFMPEYLQAVQRHSGQQNLSLHGWSMGGGLCLCYQALNQDPNIINIVTLGTAVDGHANGQIGRQYAAFGRVLKGLKLDVRKVPASWAYAPAWINALGFKLSDPISGVQGYVDLIKHLDDREFVSQSTTQSAFLDNLEAYPGGVIRDWMYSVWLENEASQGYISVAGEKACFRYIESNLMCCAGSNDKLANAHSCMPLMDMVSSTDKSFHLFPGGHTGIVSGSQAPERIWPEIADWLASRSGVN